MKRTLNIVIVEIDIGFGQLNWSSLRSEAHRSGGAAGIRTPDLRRAKAALSQLSYGPQPLDPACRRLVAGGRAWTRTRDLGLIRAAL